MNMFWIYAGVGLIALLIGLARAGVFRKRGRAKAWMFRIAREVRAEHALLDTAKEISIAQRQMLSKWADCDDAKKNELWGRLHRAGSDLFDAIEELEAQKRKKKAAV